MAATNRKFGVEIEHGNIRGDDYVAAELRKKFPRWNNTGSDGSGVEARSPILQGQSGFDELGEVMEFLKEIGGWVSQNDGMHVHHDASDIATNPPAIHRVLESYYLNQPVINKLIDFRRHKRQLIQKSELNTWKRTGLVNTGRRAVHFVPRYGTLEFRQFEGCLDPVKAIAWIEFGQKLIDSAVYGHVNPIACANAPDLLLRRIGCRQGVAKALGGRSHGKSDIPTREQAAAAAWAVTTRA